MTSIDSVFGIIGGARVLPPTLNVSLRILFAHPSLRILFGVGVVVGPPIRGRAVPLLRGPAMGTEADQVRVLGHREAPA